MLAPVFVLWFDTTVTAPFFLCTYAAPPPIPHPSPQPLLIVSIFALSLNVVVMVVPISTEPATFFINVTAFWL